MASSLKASANGFARRPSARREAPLLSLLRHESHLYGRRRMPTAIQRSVVVSSTGGSVVTAPLHGRTFSRRSFVKGGGALIVSFSLAGSLSRTVQAAGDPNQFTSYGPFDSTRSTLGSSFTPTTRSR